jgi:RND family efflux transporter MFP subunit
MRRMPARLLLLPLIVTACSDPSPAPPPPPTVLVATPMARQVLDWDDFSGRFEAVDMVEVRPRVGGIIESVHFTDGQLVAKGQLLFGIDPRPIAAQLARARADLAGARAALANADAELRRARALLETQLISKAQADLRDAEQLRAAASLAAAEAAVSTQELNLSFTQVTAPLAGRVSYRRLAPGNIVTADTTLLTTIVSENPMRFLFDAPEAALLRYRREAGGVLNRTVEIRLQDEIEYRWKGRIDFLDNTLDRNSGTIRGRAVVPNPDGFLAPGMFGQMRLFAAQSVNALLVPDEAIVTDQTRQVVYVVGTDGKVAQKVVSPGRLIDGLRVIRAGLTPADRIIISGMQRARPGRQVTVTEGTVTAFPAGVSRGENSSLALPAPPVPVPPATPDSAARRGY